MHLLGFDNGSFRPDDFVKSMPIFAAMLTASNRYRRFVVGGETAYNDGETVYLPGIKMKSPREATAFLGFALHELSHRWTDFETLKHVTTPFHKWLNNTLEDVYTDKKQHVVHPGSKPILDQLAWYLREEGFEVQPDASMPPTQLIQNYVHYRLRSSVLGESAYSLLADQAEVLVAKILPAGVLAKLRALMFEVANCDDSWGVLELSSTIVAMLEQAKDQDSEQAQEDGNTPPDGPDAGDDPDGGDATDGRAGAGDSAPDDGDGAASQDLSQSPSPSASDVTQSGSAGDDANALADADAGVDSGAGDSASQVLDSSGGADGASGSFRKVIDDLLQMTSEEAIKGIGDQLKDMVNGIAEEQISTGEFDPSLWYTPSDSVVEDDPAVSGIAEMDRVNGSVNALRVRLNAFLQARTRSSVAYKGSGRKLAVSRLSRLSYGDSRVFKHKSKGIDIDTAVMTLGDRSGSMGEVSKAGGSLLDMTLDVLLALSLSMDAIKGVQHSVAAFPGATKYVDGREQATIDVLKRWREPTKQVVSRYNRVKPSGGTPAHIALVWAGQELLKVRAARKVIFMATDGQPDEEQAVRDAVQDLRRLGIEVVGVGIGVDLGRLFDAFVRVDSLGDLAGAVFGMMRDRLLAA